MKKHVKTIVSHFVENPFITATGAAALVHSTWTLGTLMTGVQPPAGFTVEFIGWIVPAFLIAFALDVGQISTSHSIRHNGLTRYRAITFFTFSFATYYLQWLYIAHHMPEIPLATGVRSAWVDAIALARDAAIFILPGFLPFTTFLYTMADSEKTALQANALPEPSPSDTEPIVTFLDTPLLSYEFDALPEPSPSDSDTEPIDPLLIYEYPGRSVLDDFLARNRDGLEASPLSKPQRKKQQQQLGGKRDEDDLKSIQTTPKSRKLIEKDEGLNEQEN